jgi:hypothetical protein
VDILQARQWVEVDMCRAHPAPPRFTFTDTPAIHFEVEEEEVLLQFFRLFLDNPLVAIIVDETNRHTEQSQQKQPGTAKQWRPKTPDEMHVFLALVILQSIVKFPDHQLYWS